MSAIDTVDNIDLIWSLRRTVCPACGGAKQPAQTLCSKDYYRLPKEARDALYNRLGHGYREAVAAAMDLLKVEKFHAAAAPGGVAGA
jgi:hypothetical protein